MQPGDPIAHNCKTLIEPSRLIILAAQQFIQTFLGKDFVALHFRRHGFLKFCNSKKPNAGESEISLLQSSMVRNGKTVPLIQRSACNSAEKWDVLLYGHGLEGDAQMGYRTRNSDCSG
ncbi:unnamed protein product [Fraxinus pennsylvanica]|uniref:O-fucosyltransferase family protein n=1 Tax=Fraxinus pennsylvanica TaxID=56036 RepID=A0AAD2AG13_9LAMI|nr:unnamed protein product [Fraxinus pennsylvanica]